MNDEDAMSYKRTKLIKAIVGKAKGTLSRDSMYDTVNKCETTADQVFLSYNSLRLLWEIIISCVVVNIRPLGRNQRC
jgi:hypothetical protein